MDQFLTNFNDDVVLKYHIYNALFLTLPFSKTEETGALLPIFSKFCQDQLKNEKSPEQIINDFFKQQRPDISEKEKINILFRFLQFVERQIVLFDALEDAAFSKTHALTGPGSLHNLLTRVKNQHQEKKFIQKIHSYKIRVVLTAHPTQFYPPPILGILTQLQPALRDDHLKKIAALLLQMGKTSFKYEKKPTPYEEAESLVWYLEKIFYKVIPAIQNKLNLVLQEYGSKKPNHSFIDIGFWPGGDRDGNPYVTAETTLAVAKLLKSRLLNCYRVDVEHLLHKLTFTGILPKLEAVKVRLQNSFLAVQMNNQKNQAVYHQAKELLNDLLSIRETLIIEHDSLFLDTLDKFIVKVQCFGFYFAALDIRENSAINREVFQKLLHDFQQSNVIDISPKDYNDLSFSEKVDFIEKLADRKLIYQLPQKENNKLFINTIKSYKSIKIIQHQNGEAGLCRIVISNSSSALDVLELLLMLHLSAEFTESIPIDILPLFESMVDLSNAREIMQQLFENSWYRKHLSYRQNTQTVMLGFSDGTKDGGYLAANWAIYKTKLELTALAKKYAINIIFFDGRGGPPARGGGNTHAFYRSLGNHISHQQLQLTVQGQTISSNFGTRQSAKFNIEQLFTAGLEDHIFPEKSSNLGPKEIHIMNELAKESYEDYLFLKNNHLFVKYLEKMTPLRFFSELNIGSRPASRKSSKNLDFSQLRAIPFVSSWSQLKQNIPGYYGFGYALHKISKQPGYKKSLQRFYQRSLFFRTLVENAMMSLCKSFFPLTAYMKNDNKFGDFWRKLHREAELSKKELLIISKQNKLLELDSINRTSIELREEIVLPLLIIQQFALIQLNKTQNSKLKASYKNLVLKALAANTNASRNSA